jgi:hypothetical protein
MNIKFKNKGKVYMAHLLGNSLGQAVGVSFREQELSEFEATREHQMERIRVFVQACIRASAMAGGGAIVGSSSLRDKISLVERAPDAKSAIGLLPAVYEEIAYLFATVIGQVNAEKPWNFDKSETQAAIEFYRGIPALVQGSDVGKFNRMLNELTTKRRFEKIVEIADQIRPGQRNPDQDACEKLYMIVLRVAQRDLEKAYEIAQRIPSKSQIQDKHDRAFSVVCRALIQSGDLVRAEEVLQPILTESIRNSVIEAIALKHAQLGNVSEANRLANGILNRGERNSLIEQISKVTPSR